MFRSRANNDFPARESRVSDGTRGR